MFEPLEFDITLTETPVKINQQEYVLKEATGDVIRKYRNMVFRFTRQDEGKAIAVDGIADVEPFLISMCLFLKKEDKLLPVALHTISQWPSKVVARLFSEAKRISGIDNEDTIETVKKRIEQDTKILKELEDKKDKESMEKNSP